jgi:hypothetical protein
MIDTMTKLNHKRGKQIDKVYEYYNKAIEFYVAQNFSASTRTLVRLRDYLNQILPKKKAARTRGEQNPGGEA